MKKKWVYTFVFLFVITGIILVSSINLDLNHDGVINITDLQILAAHFEGKATYNSSYDFNNDSRIDLFDVVAEARQIGVNTSVNNSNSTGNVSGNVTPYFQDSFESGDLSHTQNGFKWGQSIRTHVRTTYARTGNYSLMFHYVALGTAGATTDQEHWSQQDFQLTPKGTPAPKEVWFQYYVLFPENGNYSLAPLGTHDEKLFAIWAETYGGGPNDTEAVLQWEGGSADGMVMQLDEGPTDWGNNFYVENNPLLSQSAIKGQWVQVRIHVRVGNGSTDLGMFEGWINGVEMFYGPNDPRGQLYVAGGNNYWRNGYLLGYMNTGFPVNTTFYIDDFKVWTQNPGWPDQH